MLEELKTFISVVDFKNFTKAAQYLNLSQPSVSTHIKNLESAFDVTLINRSVKQKTIFITESGYTLYKRAKEIISLLDITYSDVRTLSNSIKGTLKIGASLTTGECILPKFLSQFSNKYPDIDIEVLIENTSVISEQLKKMTLDIGIIEGSISSSSFNQEYFFEDKLVLACPYNENFLNTKIDIDSLQNQRWIARENGSGTREYLDLFLTQNKISPKSILVLGSNLAIQEAIKNNLGITLISNLVVSDAKSRNELLTYELDNNFRRFFSFIYPKEITLSKAANIFLEELRKFSKQHAICK